MDGGARPANLRLEATGVLAPAPGGTGTFLPEGGSAVWRVQGPEGGALPTAWLGARSGGVAGRLTGRVPAGAADPPTVRAERFEPAR